MNIMNLPKNMRDKIIKLAETYSLELEVAQNLFTMANGNYEQAELLCDMKSNKKSEEEIKKVNTLLWEERQQKFAGSISAK